MDKDFLLTTAPSLEGYRIVKQCGIVFGETMFRHGFFSQLGASLMDIGIGTRELDGSIGLIEKAREYAYSKMIDSAKERGANAIIAIDSDNTVGDGTMYLSLYGTAVKVVKEEEYFKTIKQEQAEIAKKEEKRMQMLQHKQKLEERRNNGEELAEDVFLSSIRDDTSVCSIFAKWEQSGLSVQYPVVDAIISENRTTEKMFGKFTKTQLDLIKHDIETNILGKSQI